MELCLYIWKIKTRWFQPASEAFGGWDSIGRFGGGWGVGSTCTPGGYSVGCGEGGGGWGVGCTCTPGGWSARTAKTMTNKSIQIVRNWKRKKIIRLLPFYLTDI